VLHPQAAHAPALPHSGLPSVPAPAPAPAQSLAQRERMNALRCVPGKPPEDPRKSPDIACGHGWRGHTTRPCWKPRGHKGAAWVLRHVVLLRKHGAWHVGERVGYSLWHTTLGSPCL